MSKPIFYTFPLSVWSAAPELALIELDLVDKVDKQVVDLLKGDNFKPDFIKLNPNATLPTLAADGKSYKNTIEVVDYLASISSVKAAPRTAITDEVHEDAYDPNLAFVIARDDAELAARASGFARVFTETRLGGLKTYAATPEAAEFKSFYDAKIAGVSGLLAIYTGDAPAEAKAKFLKDGQALYANIAKFYSTAIPNAITTGPFVAGAAPGVDDFHVTAWLTHFGAIFGGSKIPDLFPALEKGFGGPIPPKVKAYLEAWIPRPSFQKVYEQLH
ncbi:hypothetical protein DENSPDRAFT_883926 [Dentipellis sp. KUC8613]|nr:hypothetical protein DENSPDRAFT_883926 [Dentipellis sp. KUC8613]